MSNILESIQSGEIKITQTLQKKIKHIHYQASSIANRSTTFAEASNPEYFETVGFAASTVWSNFKPFRQLNISLPVPTNNEIKNYVEEAMDKCYEGLIGSKKRHIKLCTVSKHCWKMNATHGGKGYMLTHQVLYFLIGEKTGCSKVFHSWVKKSGMKGTINSFLAASCASMYLQMLEQEKLVKNKKTLEFIDLYIEQALICGMLGYEQFLSLERLDLILSYQLPMGCYGYSEALGIKKYSREKKNRVLYTTSITAKKTMRQLQVAKDLKDGCELHSSGVVTGLLGLYVRWHVHHITRQSVKKSDMTKEGQFQDSKPTKPLETWAVVFVVSLNVIVIVFTITNRRLRSRIIVYFKN